VPYHNQIIPAKITRVKDGDTCEAVIFQPSVYQNDAIPAVIDIRINGIDTPELRKYGDSRDVPDYEKEAANRVKDVITPLVINKVVPVKLISIGTYNRFIGDIYVTYDHDKEETWTDFMIKNGLARPYEPSKDKRHAWSKQECDDIIKRCDHFKF
jgi:endonuclease YncB( thermonuclease family)